VFPSLALRACGRVFPANHQSPKDQIAERVDHLHSAFLAALLLTLIPQWAWSAAPPITAAAFTPNGKAVVLGSQSGLDLRSWPELKLVKKITTKLAHVNDLAFSPAGDLLAVAGGAPAERGEVELLLWPSGKLRRRLAGHTDLVYSVAWNRKGHLATASADGTCLVFDSTTGKRWQVFQGHSRPVLAVAFTPDGKQVLSAGIDQSLRLWAVSTGQQIRSLENHVGAVHALAHRPGTDPDAPPYFASASADRTVRLWQPTIGRLVRFKRFPSPVLAAAWSPDGQRLVAGCADGRVRVIDADSLELVQEEKAVDGWVHTLVVHPTGSEVLVGGERGQLKRVRVGAK
jgi:WD40 repeat protein